MRTGITLAVMFLLSVCLSTTADDTKKEGAKPAAFEHFKKLVGEWEGKMCDENGKTEKGEKVTITYKLTAGGSAVLETIAPGTDMEMVTVIHPDGDSLLLTHYCMLGNQPQLKSDGKVEGNKVAFKFVKATNLKSEKDPHMHDVTFHFVDKDTVKTEWTSCKDGKEDHKGIFELKRKK